MFALNPDPLQFMPQKSELKIAHICGVLATQISKLVSHTVELPYKSVLEVPKAPKLIPRRGVSTALPVGRLLIGLGSFDQSAGERRIGQLRGTTRGDVPMHQFR